MKNRVFILSFLISMISVNFVFAQTSTKKLSYQAVVRNAANELVVNQNLAVEITVLDAENAPQYKETHPSVPTNQNGLLWLWVGEGTPTLGTMADVVWKDAVIRSVFTLPDGSTVTQNTPVTAMPYAYFADEVDTIFLQNYLDTHDVVPDNYVTHPQLNDTLDHYYTKGNVDNKLNDYEKKSELCGDVKECIKDTLGKYTTSNQIDTLLGAYYDTTHTKSVISDTATALRAMMGDAAYNSKITLKKNNVELDSFRLNQQTDKAINIPVPTTVAELSDAGNYTTNAQLNDTLSHYYTDKKINDTLSHYLTQEVQVLSVSNDTLYLTGGSWVKLPKGFSGDYNDLTNRPDLSVYATNVHLDDTLSYYFDTTQVKTAIHDTAVAIRAAIPAQVNADWNATSGKAEILNKPTIPTTVAELSDAANYTTNAHLNDTLSHYYDTTQVKTAIHDTANAIRAAIPAQVNADWNATGGPAEILNKPDLSVYATNAHLNDTLNSFATKDTLSAYATKDTLKNFLTISGLCDSLVKCGVIKDMRDSIRDNAAAIQINATAIQTNATNIGLNKQAIIDSSAHIRNDIKNGQITIAVNRSTATTETTVTNPTFGVNQGTDQTVTINIPQETTVNNGQLTIVAAGDTTRFTANQATNDTVRLNKFATKEALKDTAKTIRGIICDSATACITKALADPTSEINYAIDTIARHHVSDSTRMVFDTLHKYYATKDTLKNFVNKLAIRDSVNKIVKDSLRIGTSAINIAIDTIARHNIHDTAVAIRNSIGNGTLTIQKNGSTVGTFTANQSTDQPVNVNITVPTAVTDLSDAADYAKINGNTFTGTHIFNNATITVPSNTDAIKRPSTTTTPCTDMNAVNVCDLLAVFDSLTKRIDSLSAELAALKSAVPPVFNSINLSNSTSSSMKVTANFTSASAAITSYQFCYKKTGATGNAQCVTSTTNEIILDGLDPYTSYDVTASATNLAGTTPSTVATDRTLAQAPTATMALATKSPQGFTVDLSNIDFKEVETGSLKICYKLWQEPDCSAEGNYECETEVDIPSSTTTYTQNILNKAENAKYCVTVTLDNGDNTTDIIDTVRSGGPISLAITGPTSANRCGNSSIEVVYSATMEGDNASEYTFDWSVGSSTTTKDTVSLSSTTTVTCTATNIADPSIEIVGSITTAVTSDVSNKPSFTTCEDWIYSEVKSITNTDSLNWGDGHTVVGSDVAVGATNTYTTGTYTITAVNIASGCKTSKQVALGHATLHPCTVVSWNSNERGPEATSIDSLEDVDHNWYAVVQIGKQCWMKSNLRTTHYSDGTAIPNGTGSGTNNIMNNYAPYYFQPTASSLFDEDGTYVFAKYNINTYGLYYNWPATMHGKAGSAAVPSGVQGVCPAGWHLPSAREYDTLIAFVKTLPGATYYDYHEIGCMHAISGGCDWDEASEGEPGHYLSPARNISEFTVIPAGQAASAFGHNTSQGVSPQLTYLWTSTDTDPWPTSPPNTPRSYAAEIWGGSPHMQMGKHYRHFGFSVRCVRNYESGGPLSDPSVTTENASDVEHTTAILNGTIVNPDNQEVTSKGFEWKLSSATDYNTPVTVTDDDFTHILTGLTEGTSYTYRAFITYSDWTVYGDEVSFMTLIDPTVETNEATSISFTSATLNGTITNPSNFTISSKGFLWKLSTATVFDTVTVTDDLTYDLTELSDGIEYVYKAFIVFNNDTLYGTVDTFTTLSLAPTLTIYSDAPSTLALCTNGSTAVTYTATVTVAGTPDANYKYSWTVPSTSMQYTTNGNTCTVIYNSANNYTVSCTATPIGGGAPLPQATNEVTVGSQTGSLTFYTCENNYTRSVVIKSQSAGTEVNWGGAGTRSGDEYTYTADGVYTIKAVNGNCSVAKTVAIGLATTRPCTVTTPHTNSTEYTPSTGGLETENEEGKVLTVQDQDGHTYAVVQIGDKCWMRSNLRTTKFSGDTPIPIDCGTVATGNTQSSSHAYYFKPTSQDQCGDNYTYSEYNEEYYGLYYNRPAVMNGTTTEGAQGVCPKGWHVPSQTEMTNLMQSVGTMPGVTSSDFASALASGCNWQNQNSGRYPGSYTSSSVKRNISDFSIIPSGSAYSKFLKNCYPESSSTYPQIASFWTSTPTSPTSSDEGVAYMLCSNTQSLQKTKNPRYWHGFSVRCVRDAETGD